jgi:hypothetical protein
LGLFINLVRFCSLILKPGKEVGIAILTLAEIRVNVNGITLGVKLIVLMLIKAGVLNAIDKARALVELLAVTCFPIVGVISDNASDNGVVVKLTIRIADIVGATCVKARARGAGVKFITPPSPTVALTKASDNPNGVVVIFIVFIPNIVGVTKARASDKGVGVKLIVVELPAAIVGATNVKANDSGVVVNDFVTLGAIVGVTKVNPKVNGVVVRLIVLSGLTVGVTCAKARA